jgi:hypothetical protein
MILDSMIKEKLFLGLFIITVISSCSPKIQFTQEIRQKYNLTSDELSKIQFYISDEVVLKTVTPSEVKKAVDDGKLIIKTSSTDDLVVFKAKTPGMVNETVDLYTLKVAFEDGVNKNLVFSSIQNRKGGYQIKYLIDGGRNKIGYGNKDYFLYDGYRAVLLFKKKSIKEVRQTENIVKGKRVN